MPTQVPDGAKASLYDPQLFTPSLNFGPVYIEEAYQKLLDLTKRRGKGDDVPHGDHYEVANWEEYDLKPRVLRAVFVRKPFSFIDYELCNQMGMKVVKALPQEVVKALNDVVRSRDFRRFVFWAGSVCLIPFGDSFELGYEPAKFPFIGVSRPERIRDRTTLVNALFQTGLGKHYLKPALNDEQMEFDRIVRTAGWPCKPDLMRWQRVFARYECVVARKLWDEAFGLTELYYMNAVNITDRRLARSNEESYYADYMTGFLKRSCGVQSITFDDLPLVQVYRLESKDRNGWWDIPNFRRALVLQRFYLRQYCLFLPWHSFESMFSDYSELYREYAHLTSDLTVLCKPFLLDEPFPLCAVYFNVQLNPICGLGENTYERKLLRRVMFMEMIVQKVHTFYKHWKENRGLLFPEIVINKIKQSGVTNFNIGIPIATVMVVKNMDDVHDLIKSRPDRACHVITDLMGMERLTFLWIKPDGSIDERVPVRKNPYRFSHSCASPWPTRDCAMRSENLPDKNSTVTKAPATKNSNRLSSFDEARRTTSSVTISPEKETQYQKDAQDKVVGKDCDQQRMKPDKSLDSRRNFYLRSQKPTGGTTQPEKAVADLVSKKNQVKSHPDLVPKVSHILENIAQSPENVQEVLPALTDAVVSAKADSLKNARDASTSDKPTALKHVKLTEKELDTKEYVLEDSIILLDNLSKIVDDASEKDLREARAAVNELLLFVKRKLKEKKVKRTDAKHHRGSDSSNQLQTNRRKKLRGSTSYTIHPSSLPLMDSLPQFSSHHGVSLHLPGLIPHNSLLGTQRQASLFPMITNNSVFPFLPLSSQVDAKTVNQEEHLTDAETKEVQ